MATINIYSHLNNNNNNVTWINTNKLHIRNNKKMIKIQAIKANNKRMKDIALTHMVCLIN